MNDHRIIRELIARIRELEEAIEDVHWAYSRQCERFTARAAREEAEARYQAERLREAERRAWEVEEAARRAQHEWGR